VDVAGGVAGAVDVDVGSCCALAALAALVGAEVQTSPPLVNNADDTPDCAIVASAVLVVVVAEEEETADGNAKMLIELSESTDEYR
jgi:hypothetical protein